jgi:transposase-like protein
MAMTLVELNDLFPTDEECREYLVRLRWPEGVKCPKCKSDKISRLFTQKKFECSKCEYQFSVTTGTIFHDSHLPLGKWFLTTLLMMESKKGMSANQIKRLLGVNYKTAWYLCHRIRKAVEEATDHPQLEGTVEVDETYVGGRYDRRRKRARYDKQAVIGLLQRDGRFEARKIPTASRKVLVGIIKDRVSKDAKVFTDELAAYNAVEKTHRHNTVNHSMEEWVRGTVHTNSVENAWSLFKRSIVGSYHQISRKHMDAYLDEFEWRFNNRQNPHLFRDTVVRLVNAAKVEFRELVEKAS